METQQEHRNIAVSKGGRGSVKGGKRQCHGMGKPYRTGRNIIGKNVFQSSEIRYKKNKRVVATLYRDGPESLNPTLQLVLPREQKKKSRRARSGFEKNDAAKKHRVDCQTIRPRDKSKKKKEKGRRRLLTGQSGGGGHASRDPPSRPCGTGDGWCHKRRGFLHPARLARCHEPSVSSDVDRVVGTVRHLSKRAKRGAPGDVKIGGKGGGG